MPQEVKSVSFNIQVRCRRRCRGHAEGIEVRKGLELGCDGERHSLISKDHAQNERKCLSLEQSFQWLSSPVSPWLTQILSVCLVFFQARALLYVLVCVLELIMENRLPWTQRDPLTSAGIRGMQHSAQPPFLSGVSPLDNELMGSVLEVCSRGM